MLARHARSIASLAASALIFSQASALEIAPTMLVLERYHPIEILRLSNNSAQTNTYEISVQTWSQIEGRDILGPAPDIVITPPIASLDPGEDIIIRVGHLDSPIHDNSEQAYRIRIRDIAHPSDMGSQNVRIRMEFSLPLIIPAAIPFTALTTASVSNDAGNLCVHVKNDGNTYQKVVGITDRADETRRVAVQKYLLAESNSTLCTNEMGEIPAERISISFAPTYASQAKTLDLSGPNDFISMPPSD